MDAAVNKLTRDAILKASDVKIEAVDVPEWGGTVYVRNLSGTARDKFEGSRVRVVDGKVEIVHENTRARLLAMSICDEQGNLLFFEEDILDLGKKSGTGLDRCYEVAARLSGLRPKDVEEKLKNLSAALTGSSSSV
jgi:hypothetical protein